MGKIAIYTRVSSLKQVGKDGASLEVQKEKCEKLLDFHEYRREDILYFSDEGITGTNIEDRDELKKLLDMINNQKPSDENYIVGICCYDLSRISRSIKHSIEIFKLLKSNELKFYTCDNAFTGNLDSQNSKIMISIFSMLNELYIDQLREKVKPGMMKSAGCGNWQGGIPPLGYDYVPIEDENGNIRRDLVINKQESEIINKIFHLFVEEKDNLFGVSKKINNLGYRTKRGKEFSTVSVKTIIENPTYIGKVVWGKSQTIKYDEDTGRKEYNRKSAYDMNIESAVGKHEPIISEEIYYSAMKRMQERKQTRNGRSMAEARKGVRQNDYYSSNKRIFNNILKCPQCGGPMTSSLQSGHKRKDGSKSQSKVYYRCATFNAGKSTCDGYYSVAEERVFSLIKEDLLKKVELGYSIVSGYLAYRNEKYGDSEGLLQNTEEESLKREMTLLEKTKNSVEKKLKAVLLMTLEINEEDESYKQYLSIRKDLDKRIKEINEEIKMVRNRIEEFEKSRDRLVQGAVENSKHQDIYQYYLSLSLRERRELIETIYDKIIIGTNANKKRGPKKIELKEIVYTPRFEPFMLFKVLGVEDIQDYVAYLKKATIERYYPDLEEIALNDGKLDDTKLRRIVNEIDKIINMKEYREANKSRDTFTDDFIEESFRKDKEKYDEIDRRIKEFEETHNMEEISPDVYFGYISSIHEEVNGEFSDEYGRAYFEKFNKESK